MCDFQGTLSSQHVQIHGSWLQDAYKADLGYKPKRDPQLRCPFPTQPWWGSRGLTTRRAPC